MTCTHLWTQYTTKQQKATFVLQNNVITTSPHLASLLIFKYGICRSQISPLPLLPCDTSRQRLSLLLLSLLLLLFRLRCAFCSTTLLSTRLDVLLSPSSSTEPVELHTSITTGGKLPSVFPPSIG